jgi:tetratricopeptide (TPR) repeat protein
MKRAAHVVLILLLVLSAPFAAAKETWLYARSDNFEMFSSASEKESRRLLVKLEQFRAFFLASLPLRRAREPRTYVVVFNSDRTFDHYKPLYQGQPKQVDGYCVPYDDEAVMAFTTDIDPDIDDADDGSGTILHEYVHLMLHTRGMKPPLWLNEGLAELYSTFQINRDTVELGRAKDIYVEFLQQSALTPLDQLFAVTTNSSNYNDETEAPYFYAQSWALTHYLVCGPDQTNTAKLTRYLDLMDASPSEPKANFEKAFGMNYRQMQANLRQYLSTGRYYRRVGKLPLPDLSKRITFRPTTEFERDTMLLDLKWRVQGNASAAAEALRLADAHPDSPRPHELLAAIYEEEDKPGDALEHWHRADALKSENPYVYVALSRDLLSRGNPVNIVSEVLPETIVANLRRWLDRALTINPDSADALEMLAITEAQAPTIRVAAINRVQTSFSRIRDPLPTLFALAVAHWRLGDAANANGILDAILAERHATPELRQAAKDLKAQISSAKTKSNPSAGQK